MTAAELTARINTLAREIQSGAFPRPTARQAVLADLEGELAKLIGRHDARNVVKAAWYAAKV